MKKNINIRIKRGVQRNLRVSGIRLIMSYASFDAKGFPLNIKNWK